LCVLLHLLPFWMYKHFATEDGPSHLHNSAVMLDMLTTGSPVFREYYQLQFSVLGNLVSQVVLMGLLSAVPAIVADKIILSTLVVLLCAAFWYVVNTVRAEGSWLAFMIFPFVYSGWLHLGFYNFFISMSVSLFVAGYFIRAQSEFRFKQATLLTLLFVV